MVIVFVVMRRYPQGEWESQIVCGRQTAAVLWMSKRKSESDLYEWKIDRCPLL